MSSPVISSKMLNNNASSDQLESPVACTKTPNLSDRWQITISKSLQGLDLFKKYAIGTAAELPKSDYKMVGWDQFEVHSIDETKLYTTELGPCLGLTARGYDQSGQLSHTGIAHVMADDNLHREFFACMREKVKGRIELFVAGGGSKQAALVKMIKADAEKADIKVVDDVSQLLFKPIALFCKNMIYRGNSGITQLYFDNRYNPQIVANLDIAGVENLEEVLSDSTCVLRQMPNIY